MDCRHCTTPLDLVFVQQGSPAAAAVNRVVMNTGTASGVNADQLFATGQSLKRYLTDPAAAEDAFIACCTEGATATGTLESTNAKYSAAIPFFLAPGAGDAASATYLELDESNMQNVLDWAQDSGLADTVFSPGDYFVSDFLTAEATNPTI